MSATLIFGVLGVISIVLGAAGYLLLVASGRASDQEERVQSILAQARNQSPSGNKTS